MRMISDDGDGNVGDNGRVNDEDGCVDDENKDDFDLS